MRRKISGEAVFIILAAVFICASYYLFSRQRDNGFGPLFNIAALVFVLSIISIILSLSRISRLRRFIIENNLPTSKDPEVFVKIRKKRAQVKRLNYFSAGLLLVSLASAFVIFALSGFRDIVKILPR